MANITKNGAPDIHTKGIPGDICTDTITGIQYKCTARTTVKTDEGVEYVYSWKNISEGGSGSQGADGKSAYDIWLEAGNTGSADDFLASLNGPKGDKGDTGLTGPTGPKGADGTSVTITNVNESTESGGSNVITFSNGKTLTVKNGKDSDETKVNQLSETVDKLSGVIITETRETHIPLDGAMHIGKVMQQGNVDTTDENYMYTDRIYLGNAKTFRLTCINANSKIISPALRYVTAYDSTGNVMAAFSLQNIDESTDVNREIVMDKSVDSVIITIYKASIYTDKVVSVSLGAVVSVDPDKLTNFQITFTDKEVCQGNYKNGVADFMDKRSICTRGYIKPFIERINVVSENVQVAVVVYNKGAYVRTDAWYTYHTSYDFDHKKYQYKIYMTNTDDSYIHNYEDVRKSVTLNVSTSDILYAYNTMEAEYSVEREHTNKMVESMMRRNYNIAYANTPEANGLVAYTGNNQIVHPKVLYFPKKFGGHRYWMAYTPYPWANDVYENPCIAYSDDGYEWTNIPGNPLDDPKGDGYNSDTHLVYVEDTNTLEVWYRYVGNYDNEVVDEIIYRQTSTDGVNWTEKEVVITNASGDYVQYLSPAIIHDGEKYKMWVVNGGNKTIYYYETTDLSSFNEIRTIDISFTDAEELYLPWHIDVIEDNGQIVLLCMAKSTASTVEEQSWTLFMSTSTDNEIFSTPTVVIQGNPYGWDEKLYRSSIVNVDGEYRIYYSAQNRSQKYGLGISTSNTLHNFVGKW